MKKNLLIVIFVMFATVVFAQEAVYTSEGVYYCHIEYIGKNAGQKLYDIIIDDGVGVGGNVLIPNIKLSNGQLECVDKMLGRYQKTKGDTFSIAILTKKMMYTVICEYTSNTQYEYWAVKNLY